MKNISIYINAATDGYSAEVRLTDDLNYIPSIYFIANDHDSLLRKISNHISSLQDLETE